jgi:hypothetical protein
MTDLAARLRAPFDPARVSWRVGATTKDKARGLALAYIDARDVMERLDDVCGIAGWQKTYPHANGKTVCNITIKIGDEWITKSDGAGDTDVEAEKGALSDAFKRAAVSWGIGRYLYDVESIWVELDEHKSIKKSEYAKLTRLLAGQKPAPVATPEPPEKTDAEVYTEAALITIDSGIYVDRQNAVSWFNGEKEARRKYGLTQGHVDLLLAALNKKYPPQKEAT